MIRTMNILSHWSLQLLFPSNASKIVFFSVTAILKNVLQNCKFRKSMTGGVFTADRGQFSQCQSKNGVHQSIKVIEMIQRNHYFKLFRETFNLCV